MSLNPIVLAMALVIALLTASAAQAAPQTCRDLRGYDNAVGRPIKLVEEPNDRDGYDWFLCMRPNGRVFRVTSDPYPGGPSLRFSTIAGSWVELRAVWRHDPSGWFATSRWAFNTRTGGCYPFGGFVREYPDYYPDPFLMRTRTLDARGRVVATFSDGTTTEIRAFTPAGLSSGGLQRAGKPMVLDRGPASELPPEAVTLRLGIAHWVRAGEPRSTAIPHATRRFRSRCR